MSQTIERDEIAVGQTGFSGNPTDPYRVPTVTWNHKGLTLTALTGATIKDLAHALAPVNCPNEELVKEGKRVWLNLWHSLMAFRDISGNTIFRNPDAEFVMWELDNLEPCEIVAEVEEVLEQIRLAQAELFDAMEGVNQS
jgi:hypothetical protein